MTTNATIRERTRQEKLENIIRKKRLTWMGHVSRMDKERRANQVMKWTTEGKRRRGRPRKNWMDTIRKDVQCMEMTWEETTEKAMDG